MDEDRIGIDRKFLTSSSTLHFLIKNGFDIADSFHYGVGYLSRAEEEHALKFFHEKQERLAKIADVAVGPDDQEALNFYRSSRFTISEWINKKGIVSTSWPDWLCTNLYRQLIPAFRKTTL